MLVVGRVLDPASRPELGHRRQSVGLILRPGGGVRELVHQRSLRIDLAGGQLGDGRGTEVDDHAAFLGVPCGSDPRVVLRVAEHQHRTCLLLDVRLEELLGGLEHLHDSQSSRLLRFAFTFRRRVDAEDQAQGLLVLDRPFDPRQDLGKLRDDLVAFGFGGCLRRRRFTRVLRRGGGRFEEQRVQLDENVNGDGLPASRTYRGRSGAASDQAPSASSPRTRRPGWYGGDA